MTTTMEASSGAAPDLRALLERVEATFKPSKELDRLIARQFGWHRVEPRVGGGMRGGWIAPEDFMGVDSRGAPLLDSLHGTDIHREVPHFTASIDAALALVEREMPEDTWGLLNEAMFDATVKYKGAISAPLPRALLAALLKAKIANSPQEAKSGLQGGEG